MNNGKLIDPDTLQFERLLPGTLVQVWEYLTDPDKRALWFAGGEMDPFPGGKVTYRFNHKNLSPEDDPIPSKYKDLEEGMTSVANVLTYDPPRLLVIGWEGGEVSFKLEEAGDKVKLTLTHSNLPEDPERRVGTMAGWHTHLDIMVDRLSGKDPKGFWGVLMPLEKVYTKILSESLTK